MTTFMVVKRNLSEPLQPHPAPAGFTGGDQLPLALPGWEEAFAKYAPVKSVPSHGMTVEQRFWLFHDQNPHVYEIIVILARQRAAAGAKKWSVRAAFHIMRWQWAVLTRSDEGFKLNNVFSPYYADLIMRWEPDLAGFFERRHHREDDDD